MKADNHTNYCRKICKSRVGFLNLWLTDHITRCPRCQRKLAAVNRVEIAMMLMKTQPQDLGLLARANSKALDMLKHSLRYAPQSAGLRTMRADQNRLEKIRPGLERVMNTAACIFIVFMIKTGISQSLLDYKEQGETAIKNYYTRNLDSQLFDELFTEDSQTT